MRRIASSLLLPAMLAWACSESSPVPEAIRVTRDGTIVVTDNRLVRIEYDLARGRWSAFGPDGDVSIQEALSRVDPEEVASAPGSGEPCWSYTIESIQDALGHGKRVAFQAPPDTSALTVSLAFTVYEGRGFFTISQTLTNVSRATVRAWAQWPLVTSPEGGAFLGRKLDTHRILDNSSTLFPDIHVNIIPGNKPASALWNVTIHDLDSGKSLVAGFLSFERGMPTLALKPSSAQSPDGREGWSFAAAVGLAPGKPIAPGDVLTSETLYLDFLSPTPQEGLEAYAENLARNLGKPAWAGRVPSGWNAWGGGEGQGGYGQDVNEEIILRNLDFMATNFGPFGQEYFQVDDGWQVSRGDWATNTARFPHGMKWLADEIRARGFRPGLWIAPFDAETTFDSPGTSTQVDTTWTVPTKSLFGVPCSRALDLSNPDAIHWASDLFSLASRDWGYGWVKLDFDYCALLYQYMNPTRAAQHDMSLTFGETYRQGMKAVRRAIGDETFFLGVAGTGLSAGIVDGMRISLDNMPWWEGPNPADDWSKGPQNILCYPVGKACFSQGVKPTVRTVARRYYLHGRVWVNHPDMMFFRPPLTEDESRSFAALVAMSGGVAKLGDRVCEMGPFGVDVYRKMLPVHGVAGRPIDLFTRELPEVWDLKVARPFERWDVVGLFNWGTNMDLAANPYRMIPESTRALGLELSSIGLDPGSDYLAYDFWNEEFIGSVRGTLSLPLPPRQVKLVALRQKLDRPQLLGTNRHFTMGGEDIEDVAWDAGTSTLTVSLAASTGTRWEGKEFPFEHHLAFHVPDGYALADIESEPHAAAEVKERTGTLLRLAIHGDQNEKVSLKLRFER